MMGTYTRVCVYVRVRMCVCVRACTCVVHSTAKICRHAKGNVEDGPLKITLARSL